MAYLYRNSLAIALLVVALFVHVGCSGLAQTGQVYTADLGRAPSHQVMTETVRGVLQSYGYQIRRADQRLLETEWQNRSSRAVGSEDEIVETRDRARVRINQRGRSNFVAGITMVYETRGEDGQWTRTAPSEELLEVYEAMEQEARDRLGRYMVQH